MPLGPREENGGEAVCCVDASWVWSESASVGAPLSDPRGSEWVVEDGV